MRTCCGLGSAPAIAASASLQQSRDRRIGLGEAVVGDQQVLDRRRRPLRRRAAPAPTLRNTPAVAASQPTVSNDGDMSITPLVSMRPCVVRMP